MVTPEPLPVAREGENMLTLLADWARRYRALARRTADLQTAVQECGA